MKRNNSQLAHLALGMLMVLLGACTPSSLITPAQQTAVAATGMAAANSALTATTGDQSPAPSATMVSGSSPTSSPAVPVTGSTAFPTTVTPVPATTTAPNATSGATTAVGSATPAPTGTSGTTGSGGTIPNTGATSTVSGSSTSTVGSATGCGGLLNVGAAGQSATLWIKNDTNGPINFTMGLGSANTLGQCGYMTWGPIKAGQNLRVAVPVTQTTLGDSCYWAYATTTNSNGSSSVVTGQSGGYCITTPTRWVINIHNDRIRLVGP